MFDQRSVEFHDHILEYGLARPVLRDSSALEGTTLLRARRLVVERFGFGVGIKSKHCLCQTAMQTA